MAAHVLHLLFFCFPAADDIKIASKSRWTCRRDQNGEEGGEPLASLIVRPGWWVIKLFYDLVFHDTRPPSLHCLFLHLHLLRLLTLWSASTWSLSSFTQRCAARRAMGAGLSCQSGSGRGPLSVLMTCCCCWSWNRSVICVTGAMAGKSLSLHYCWLFICRCAWLQRTRRGVARQDRAASSLDDMLAACLLAAFWQRPCPHQAVRRRQECQYMRSQAAAKGIAELKWQSQKVKVQVERCCCSSDNNKVVVLFIAINGGTHKHIHTHIHRQSWNATWASYRKTLWGT